MVLVCIVAPALPALAQVPLVVGVVRDQRGAVIPDALVEGRRLGAPALQTTTDAGGTFSLAGAGIVSILVRCRYCSPAAAAVRSDEPVVIIVRRYEALAADAPTAGDLESLPYGHVESAIALRPFTLLAQSSTAYPGPTLSDRGLSSTGSLLVDDGVPNYDIVAGSSPYELIPAQYERSATVADASNAYLYGDQAAGGIVGANPFGTDSNWQVATLGSDTIARAQVGSDAAEAAFGSFSNDQESRQRADVSGSWSPGSGQTLGFSAGTEQGRDYGSPSAQYAGSFSFADASYGDPQLANFYASAILDRGDDTVGGEYPATTIWSDSSLNLGVHTRGSLSAFADLGVRASTGLFNEEADPYGAPPIGATLTQTRADAGLKATGKDYDVTAGVGTFWIDYAGGSSAASQSVKADLAVPSLQAKFFADSRWSVDLEDSGSFSLPTFVEQYAYGYAAPTSVEYQRNALLAGTLSYTDEARLRLSFEEASQRVTGASSGTITSAGLSAAWQIAPSIALRAWTMHVTDDVPPYGAALSYTYAASPTVDALWLTYEGNEAIRFDAIYRRDLLDGSPFYHVDGDFSGPVANAIRWYAGVEDRLRRTFVDVGLRFGGQ
jgi:hypothetical protein